VLQQAIAGDMYQGRPASANVARAAVRGLAGLGPAASSALPDLTRAYRTFNAPGRDIREDVLAAYGKIGPKALPLIRDALGDSIWNVRAAAVDALGETADTSADTLEALRAAEADASVKVRKRATAVLQAIEKQKEKPTKASKK
jgi:HEAT repeat protein